jgi:hypothetical protein
MKTGGWMHSQLMLLFYFYFDLELCVGGSEFEAMYVSVCECAMK